MKNSNRGFTLVEVLAVIVIGAIIVVAISSILFNATTQHTNQQADTRQLQDISYALKVITRDIRKSKDIDTSGSLIRGKDEVAISYQFDKNTNSILRNGEILTTGVADFHFYVAGVDIFTQTPINTSTLSIIPIKLSITNKLANGKDNLIETEVVLRRN